MDVAVLRGGGLSVVREVEVQLPNETSAWTDAVRRLGEVLNTHVNDLGCAGEHVHVVYESPTQVSDIVSSPVRSRRAALSAAELTCLDAMPYSASSAVMAAAYLGRDNNSAAEQTHVAIAAERDEVTEAIGTMVMSGGLLLRSITPIDSAMKMLLSEQLLDHRSSAGGVLYIGELHSYFLVGGAGSIRFHRQLNLGTAGLREALTRPIRSNHAAEVTLTNEQAGEVLQRHGFPERDVSVCNHPPLRGADIIPLLQPCLQRFLVELRQSLRFGLAEHERASLRIRLAGPGAMLPGLAGVIEAEFPEQVHAGDLSTVTQPTPSGQSDLSLIVKGISVLDRLSLLPKQVARSRAVQTLRSGLWLGAAAAMLVVGLDTWRLERQLADIRIHATAVANEKNDRDILRSTTEQLQAMLIAGRSIEQRIGQEMSLRPPVSPLLREISLTVPESIRLTSLTFTTPVGELVGTISGMILGEQGALPDESLLERFVTELQRSPLLDHVTLEGVQTGQMEGRSGISFDIRFTSVGYFAIAHDLQGQMTRFAGEPEQ